MKPEMQKGNNQYPLNKNMERKFHHRWQWRQIHFAFHMNPLKALVSCFFFADVTRTSKISVSSRNLWHCNFFFFFQYFSQRARNQISKTAYTFFCHRYSRYCCYNLLNNVERSQELQFAILKAVKQFYRSYQRDVEIVKLRTYFATLSSKRSIKIVFTENSFIRMKCL